MQELKKVFIFIVIVILTNSIEEVLKTKVLTTYINGERVFELK